MIIFKCDVCDKITGDDILPPTWSTLQLAGPQGTEGPAMHRARHLCDEHTLEALIEKAKA